MREENVLKLCSIDCSSPISAYTESKTATSEPSSAGIGRPACAITVQRPTVFSVTVFPPVFGPVITIVVISVPNSISLATDSLTGISGCLAWDSLITPSLFTSGFVYLLTAPYFALASTTSMSDNSATRRNKSWARPCTISDNSSKILSISSFSFILRLRISLFA